MAFLQQDARIWSDLPAIPHKQYGIIAGVAIFR